MLLLWPSLSILPFTPSRPWPCPFLVSCLLISILVAPYSTPMVPLAFLRSISIPCLFLLFSDLLSGWLLLIPITLACQVIYLIKLELPIFRHGTFSSAHVSSFCPALSCYPDTPLCHVWLIPFPVAPSSVSSLPVIISCLLFLDPPPRPSPVPVFSVLNSDVPLISPPHSFSHDYRCLSYLL